MTSRARPADTIYALSSGQPPAAIAVVRISGPGAGEALRRLCGRIPEPRRATLADVLDAGELLDRALVLFFPGPNSATGEDLAELHLHGGRAVVVGVLAALSRMGALRPAEGGEFTRRALGHGRIDLTEAEGLADLLEAETEAQRRAALQLAGGSLARKVAGWTTVVLHLSAAVEAVLDFSDEGDVEPALGPDWENRRRRLLNDMQALLAQPPVEQLKEGLRVVIAGLPNAGKSTLLNALAGRDAAIVSEIAGTTRDLIEAPVSIGGVPFLLIDSAGLRSSADRVESIGVARAEAALAAADIVLWLGDPLRMPARENVLVVHAKADLARPAADGALPVSAHTGEGVGTLLEMIAARGRALLPPEGQVALNARHREAVRAAAACLEAADPRGDLLIVAEELRQARLVLDRVTGRAGVEDMLDALFGRFCIGK